MLETNLNKNVLICLYRNGYIGKFFVVNGYIQVYLKYPFGVTLIKNLICISKSSRWVYWSYSYLLMMSLKGWRFIFSSSKGVFINVGFLFKFEKVGGEVLFEIL